MYVQRKQKCIHKINNFFVRDAKKVMEDFQEEEGQRQNKKEKTKEKLTQSPGRLQICCGRWQTEGERRRGGRVPTH